jgi:hypothetical protein
MGFALCRAEVPASVDSRAGKMRLGQPMLSCLLWCEEKFGMLMFAMAWPSLMVACVLPHARPARAHDRNTRLRSRTLGKYRATTWRGCRVLSNYVNP